MIERIKENELRFDNILLNVKELEVALNNFKNNEKDLFLLNKYYGSKNWFKDKELYENNKIKNIKAGVLSEDGVWNMLDELDELINDMKNIILEYEGDK
jgi:hypothetical protein